MFSGGIWVNAGFDQDTHGDASRVAKGGPAAGGGEYIDLNRLVLRLRRQLPVIGLGAIGGFFVAAFVAFTEIPEYRAIETVLLNEVRGELLDQVSAIPFAALTDSAVQSEVEIVKSRGLAVKVARDLNLADDPDFMEPPISVTSLAMLKVKGAVRSVLGVLKSKPDQPEEGGENGLIPVSPLDKAAEALRSKLKVERVARSFVIEIIYADHDPVRATRIARAYGEAYRQFQLDSNFEAASGASHWLEGRLKQLEAQSLSASVDLAQFRRENDLTDSKALGQLTLLEQRAESYMEIYLDFLRRYELSRQQTSFPVASIEIISLATEPEHPSSPRKAQMATLGLILGALLGGAVALLREFRSNRLRNRSDLSDELGLRFLGFAPEIGAVDPGRLRRIFRKRPGFGQAQRQSETQDAEDSERVVDQTLSSLLVTAGVPEARGTSWVALVSIDPTKQRQLAQRFADFAAGIGETTLFIDASSAEHPADFERRTRKETFRIDKRRDRSDVLVLENAIEAGILLSSLRAPNQNREIEAINQTYDRVILLAPPILQSRLAGDIARHMDAIFLLAEWERSTTRLVTDLLEYYPELDGRLSGVVLCGGHIREIRRNVSPNSLDAGMLTPSRRERPQLEEGLA